MYVDDPEAGEPLIFLLEHPDCSFEWVEWDDSLVIFNAMCSSKYMSELMAKTKGFDQDEAIGVWNKYTVWQPSYTDEPLKLLGETEIEANVLVLDELNTELAEIDENLIKN